MKIIQKILLHFIIILIVTILPVIVYNFMSNHQYNDFEFIGGITYFIYAFCLILKIKNQRAKIILSGILYLLLSLCTGMLFTEINEFSILFFITINLIVQGILLIKNAKSKNRALWKSYLISFAITIILSFFFTFLWFLAMAASGMPSNHY
jgi:membrane-associated HD superfamily phosphohydrolase